MCDNDYEYNNEDNTADDNDDKGDNDNHNDDDKDACEDDAIKALMREAKQYSATIAHNKAAPEDEDKTNQPTKFRQEILFCQVDCNWFHIDIPLPY